MFFVKYKKKLSNLKAIVFTVNLTLTLFVSAWLFLPHTVFAAATPTGELLKPIGSGAPTSYGDYISSTGGLNTYYSYFIEVPSGVRRLIIDIYDADIGMGTPETNDWTNDTYNTSVTYRVYTPGGSTVNQNFTTGSSTGPAGSNNNWLRLCRVNNPAVGHWEVRVNMSSSVTGGNDMNAFGIRATNPNGIELNIYAASFAPAGVVGTGATLNTTLYPYVTSGCTVYSNDWDGDNGGSTLCSLRLRSRTRSLSTTFNGSGVTVWLNNPISGFTRDDQVSDYGIWDIRLTYTDTGANANFGIFYLENYNASGPPPTSQPQNNTFRIYFPTNGGSPPLKPFLTQNISYVSGPNPPTNGSTSRVRIGVTVFNPSAQSITFSAGNLITANIPGSGVVYAGNPSVTQGAVTSQPAIGATGNITWNPGAVGGSGNYETLYYDVDVTPTSAGQRIPVTGTPGSNGTTATYVDETGNTTQARATFTFGPLCELAVTEGTDIPTLANISSFKAYEENGRVVVQWETDSEIGSAGFFLLRRGHIDKQYKKVNHTLLPALLHFPSGGVYRMADETARYGETYTYKLVEIESDGRPHEHGPFRVTIGAGDWNQAAILSEPLRGAFDRTPHAVSFEKQRRLLARKEEASPAKTSGQAKGKGAFKIAVKETGLYYLSAADIARAAGIGSEDKIITLIGNHNFSLSNRGSPVSWLAAGQNTGIYFYGKSLVSIYSDENIYRLTVGGGARMAYAYGGSALPGSGGETFIETLHIEEDRYALTALFSDPAADFWFWDFISAGSGSKVFTFQAPGAAPSGSAYLAIHLKGATNTDAHPDHHAQINLNGYYIGECRWDGLEEFHCKIPIDSSLLIDGENSLEISGLPDTGAPYSIFYLDSFDLSYNRYYRAMNNRLLCRGDNNPVVTVSGFTHPLVRVFDVTHPAKPRLVTGTSTDPANRISFVPEAPGNLYLVVSARGILSPVSITGDRPSNLKLKRNSADYIVISGTGLERGSESLADLRRFQGFEAMVVAIEDIYDEFNDGIAGPLAIKDFLSYAYRQWQGKVPKYVVLAGAGTYDYKNILDYGDNIIPPLLVNTPKGLFASDIRFGDVTGNDGIPEIAVGRLPVLTNAEFRSYIDKLSDYENSGGDWTHNALMLADNPDDGGDFPYDSDYLANLLPGYRVDKVYLPDFPGIEKAREKLFRVFNGGTALVNYIGHAGLDRLAAEGLLKSGDIPTLQNGARLPLVTAFTCVAGRFAVPGYDCLSEVLLLKTNGGAVAVWAPTGASYNSAARRLAEEFFKVLNLQQEKVLGRTLIKAMRAYAASGEDPFILDIYNLLGDPALEIK